MRTVAIPREINFMKVGAVAAFLLAASVAVMIAGFGALSDATPRTETEELLDDLVDKKNFAIALVWLGAFISLLLVPYSLGLYYGLRRWGESYMRVAVLWAVVAAIFQALSLAPVAVLTAYIVPAWGEAGDEATRAILLSDAKALAWASDAMFVMFDVTIAIATIAASLVMLRLGQRLWSVVGWIGIASGLLGIFGAFFLAVEEFEVVDMVSGILAIIWILGAGVGLWRLSEAEAT